MEYREEIWNYKWKAKDDRTNQTVNSNKYRKNTNEG
jgi:hypothetical protein